MADTKPTPSPFDAALKSDPRNNARKAETEMDSPHRREVEKAQDAKKKEQATDTDERAGDAVIKGNVRSPIGP